MFSVFCWFGMGTPEPDLKLQFLELGIFLQLTGGFKKNNLMLFLLIHEINM